SWRICWLSEGCAVCRRLAARVKLSSSATATKYLRCRNSTSKGYRQGDFHARPVRAVPLAITTCDPILDRQELKFQARGFGGRRVPGSSPRQLKEVIQVAHTNVGSVASLGALVRGEVRL